MKQQKNKRFKKPGRETAQRKTIPSFPISVIAPVSMYSEVKEKGEEPVIGQAYLFINKPWGRTGGKIILTGEILTVFQLI